MSGQFFHDFDEKIVKKLILTYTPIVFATSAHIFVQKVPVLIQYFTKSRKKLILTFLFLIECSFL